MTADVTETGLKRDGEPPGDETPTVEIYLQLITRSGCKVEAVRRVRFLEGSSGCRSREEEEKEAIGWNDTCSSSCEHPDQQLVSVDSEPLLGSSRQTFSTLFMPLGWDSLAIAAG